MGDQIGESLKGDLVFVSESEISKIFSAKISHQEKKEILATVCRINALYMIANAGSGHIGSSFSSMEIMTSILYDIYHSGALPKDTIFFSSKGHDAPALYANLMAFGLIDFGNIHALRTADGLPGHPDVGTPGIVTNTGSLGMGVSKAKGFINAARISGSSRPVIVITGDGELQEGQFWESLISAVNKNMGELTIVVDHNKLQSDTLVSLVSDLGDLEAKFRSFGFLVHRCDGNSVHELDRLIASSVKVSETPTAIIADTIKGKGVSFMEHTSIDSDVELYKFHSGAPDDEAYKNAVRELIEILRHRTTEAGLSSVELSKINKKVTVAPTLQKQKLVDAYSFALVRAAETNKKILALDADLVLDTGLIPFQKKYPDRFIECGIAEQDMVSQAGTLALSGFLPIVHSFACFLTARPMEQIYNNASEHSKIIYVGTLSGLIPAGPGHSHQGIRDIACMGSIPGIVVLEPANTKQVTQAVDWAIESNKKSTYIRLCSFPVSTNGFDYNLPLIGTGNICREGSEGVIIASGPIMLGNAMAAAKLLAEEGTEIAVIDMPWITDIRVDWLEEAILNTPHLLVLDNHFKRGGLMDRVNEALMQMNSKPQKISHLAVEDVPICGKPDEVLTHHKLDIETIRKCMCKITQ